MPPRNSVKQYIDHGYYHLYNRGVEKRDIFPETQDYHIFLLYLQQYLLPKEKLALQSLLQLSDPTTSVHNQILKLLSLKNFSSEAELLAYALQSNHFHLLIKQNSADTIDRLMNALITRYVLYFNKKYNRVGPLFQGVYKAVLIQTDEQLLEVSRYIHLNPYFHGNLPVDVLNPHVYCSLPEYLGKRSTEWTKTSTILQFFSKTKPANSYADFLNLDRDFDSISDLLLESEL
jgi:putative transposase